MDRRLRELERLEVGGDPAAAAALLSARVRAGTIPADRLALAAFLGDPRAERVVGRHRRWPSRYRGRWIRALVGFSPEAAEQALLILHRMIAGMPLALPGGTREREAAYRLPLSFAAALVAAERWVATRDPADARCVLEQVTRYADDCAPDPWEWPRWPGCALDQLVRGALAGGRAGRAAEATFRDAIRWRSSSSSRWHRAQVGQALRAELTRLMVAWALDERPA